MFSYFVEILSQKKIILFVPFNILLLKYYFVFLKYGRYPNLKKKKRLIVYFKKVNFIPILAYKMSVI